MRLEGMVRDKLRSVLNNVFEPNLVDNRKSLKISENKNDNQYFKDIHLSVDVQNELKQRS